jgi:hypothetical protein
MGVTDLRVEGREGLSCLNYHREMRGKMGEVRLQKSLQHRAGSHLAARAWSQGRAVSERAGHQARVVEVAETGVAGNNSAHS